MNCTRVSLPGGASAIVCCSGHGAKARRRRCACGALEAFLCDWRGWGHHTCDQPICGAHAFQVGADKHLCPAHVEQYRLWLRDVVGVAY